MQVDPNESYLYLCISSIIIHSRMCPTYDINSFIAEVGGKNEISFLKKFYYKLKTAELGSWDLQFCSVVWRPIKKTYFL